MKYKYLTILMLGSSFTVMAQDAKSKEETSPAQAPKAKAEEIKKISIGDQIQQVIKTATDGQAEFMKELIAEYEADDKPVSAGAPKEAVTDKATAEKPAEKKAETAKVPAVK